jgi:Holliday junction resolvasome RuvABC endonuclease subunit
MTKSTVLAIELGSRELGFAVLKHEQFVHYGVKSLRRAGEHPGRVTVLKRVLTILIEQNAPTTITIVQPRVDSGPQNDMRRRLFDAVQLVAENHKLLVCSYPLSSVKKTVAKDSNATNRRLAGVICDIYPHLRPYAGSTQKWRLRYMQHMFNAAACGFTHRTLEALNAIDNDDIED